MSDAAYEKVQMPVPSGSRFTLPPSRNFLMSSCSVSLERAFDSSQEARVLLASEVSA